MLLCLTASSWGAMSDEDFVELCKNGTVQEIRSELLKGANPNAKNDNGVTALMLAAGNNFNSEVLSLLLKAGADVNAKNQWGGTALMEVVRFNPPVVVSILLKAGADVNAKNNSGGTTLMAAAAKNKDPEVISLLLEAGANVNAKSMYDKTALIEAASRNTPRVISLLLKAGADVNAKDKDGKTAIDIARAAGNTAVVAVMEELSGDPEVLYQLGIQYATGDGVKEDTKKGVELLCQAAEQGHQKAKDALKLFE